MNYSMWYSILVILNFLLYVFTKDIGFLISMWGSVIMSCLTRKL